MSTVIYNKENIYKEFDVAKQKDIELSDKKTLEGNKNHTTRLVTPEGSAITVKVDLSQMCVAKRGVRGYGVGMGGGPRLFR